MKPRVPALVRADIAERLIYKLNFPKTVAVDFVEDFFETISESLCTGEEVKLTGFGNFAVRKKNERPGRNPRTGALVTIAPRRVVTFKAGTKLKSRIDNSES